MTLLLRLSELGWPDEAEEATHQWKARAHVHNNQLDPRPRTHARVLPCWVDDVTVLDDRYETCYGGKTATSERQCQCVDRQCNELVVKTYRAPRQNKDMTSIFCLFFI